MPLNQTAAEDTGGRQLVDLYDGLGKPITSFPDGSLSVTLNPKTIFDDTYATSSTLDTTNRWNTPISAGGGVAAAVPVGGGDVALGTGTTINGYSVLTSQYNFNQLAPGFIELQNAINLEFPITTNTYRYWGFATPQSVPTAANPIQDGMGFEVATTGKMFAVCYSGGTRNIIADLSTSTGNSTQPQDNAVHKYFIYFRGDLAYWIIDTTTVATMLTGALGPINNTLPIAFLAIAGSSAPSSSGVLTVNGTWAGDTSGSSSSISDGTFLWRKAAVKAGSIAPLATDPALVVTVSPNSMAIVQGPSGTPGTPSGGILTVQGNLTGSQIPTRDVLNISSQYRAQSITTTAGQALGAATILVNRKFISITPTNGVIYWGTNASVTTASGSPLFPNNTLFLSCTDNSQIWLIAAVTTDCRIAEFS